MGINCNITFDEFAIISFVPQIFPKNFHICRWRQAQNQHYLRRVNQKSLIANNVSHQHLKRCTKDTFFRVQCNRMLLTSLEHQLQVFQVVPNQTIHYAIIHVSLKQVLNKIFKRSDNNSRKYRRCIIQTQTTSLCTKSIPIQ